MRFKFFDFKKIVVIGVLLGVACFSFAAKSSDNASAPSSTEEGQRLLDDFWQLRLDFTSCKDDADAVKLLDKFMESNKERIDALGEQARVLFDSLEMMERYNYTGGIPGERKEDKKFFQAQRKRIRKYINSLDDDNVDKYLYLVYSDVTAYYITYSIADVILHGKSVKTYYEKAVKIDENFSPAILNIGSWCFYAPKMFGGGKKRAKENFQKAYDCARTDSEKYFAAVCLSQVLFELEEFDECKKWLDLAGEICPGSKNIKLIEEQNEKGMSFYEYQKTKSSIMQAGDKYKEKEGWE